MSSILDSITSYYVAMKTTAELYENKQFLNKLKNAMDDIVSSRTLLCKLIKNLASYYTERIKGKGNKSQKKTYPFYGASANQILVLKERICDSNSYLRRLE